MGKCCLGKASSPGTVPDATLGDRAEPDLPSTVGTQPPRLWPSATAGQVTCGDTCQHREARSFLSINIWPSKLLGVRQSWPHGARVVLGRPLVGSLMRPEALPAQEAPSAPGCHPQGTRRAGARTHGSRNTPQPCLRYTTPSKEQDGGGARRDLPLSTCPTREPAAGRCTASITHPRGWGAPVSTTPEETAPLGPSAWGPATSTRLPRVLTLLDNGQSKAWVEVGSRCQGTPGPETQGLLGGSCPLQCGGCGGFRKQDTAHTACPASSAQCREDNRQKGQELRVHACECVCMDQHKHTCLQERSLGCSSRLTPDPGHAALNPVLPASSCQVSGLRLQPPNAKV